MSTSIASPPPLPHDVRTISLVGLAHGTSHFFHMLLPPLFPLFVRDFGVTYAQLGLLVTVFFAISGVGQALSGFIVDRFGARPALYVALTSFVAAAIAGALAQGLPGLVLAAALAGVGNAPFHPVDFTILNKRVSPTRLGHAFSAHGISGNLGWAAAPVVLLGIVGATGSWRVALGCAAAWAALVLMLMVWQRDAIDDRHGLAATVPHHAGARRLAEPPSPLSFLKLPALWLCFSFFFWSTAALSAIQSFASPAMQTLYGLPLSVTSYVVTGYMLCGAVGMFVGGFLTPRVTQLERVIALSFCFAALLLLVVGATLVGPTMAIVLASLAGFGTGLAGPSRDMLIKRAAPPGATGRVYGTVYSGLDLGFALAAPLFGILLDRNLPAGIFYGAAAMLMIGVLSAALVGQQLGTPRNAAALAQ